MLRRLRTPMGRAGVAANVRSEFRGRGMAGLCVECRCEDAWIKYGPQEIHEMDPGIVFIHHGKDETCYHVVCRVENGMSFIYCQRVGESNKWEPVEFDEFACIPLAVLQCDGESCHAILRNSFGVEDRKSVV